MVAVDVGLGSGRKNEKKGFKVDRYERYQAKRRGDVLPQDKNKKGNKKEQSTTAVREVKFDESSRNEFLTGFHKRKNERRVRAFSDAKKKMAKENQKMRVEQREEARLAYNHFAKVPILPDYSYRLPDYIHKGKTEDGDDEGDVQEMEDERMLAEERFGEDQDVVVHVQPLFGRQGGSSSSTTAPAQSVNPKIGKRNNATVVKGSLDDFSDLPEAVAAELRRLRMTEKGPSRTKPKQNTLKQLEKIRTIRKHSKKGHGKKGAKKKGR